MAQVSLRRLTSILLAVALLAAGCGGDESAASSDTSGQAALVDEQVEVLAIDNAFDPETIEVEAGTTVVWRNTGRNDHNVVPVDDDADWGIATEDFLPGDRAEARFTEPGTYRYYCSIHGTAKAGMTGQIVVTEPGNS